MKKLKRLLFGVASSLLLAAGFVRAASHVDPITAELGGPASKPLAGSLDCSGGGGSLCDGISDSA